MFDSPTQASSSSSTLVTATTDSTSTQSPVHTYASDPKAFLSQKPKPRPKLCVNTSLSTTRLGSNSPKMSDKGFIQPHPSHLPRRVKRERTKTAPVPASHPLEHREHQLEQSLREQLHLDHQLEPQPIINPIPTAQPNPLPPSVSTHPHRDNLPRRRTRVHERSNTAPPINNNIVANNTRTQRLPLPLPISIVDSQSTIGPGQQHANLTSSSVDPPPPLLQEACDDDSLLTPNPPPLKLSSKALSLISKAQNKAFHPRPSHIRIDNDNDDANYVLSSPASPQLPHPAMGLTMGIMEAYASEEKINDNDDDVVEAGVNPANVLLRFGLNYSPAMGVKGTPPVLPVAAHTPPDPWSVGVPATAIPTILITTATPTPGLTTPLLPPPPASAPLGQNLPRRHHRYRRRAPPQAEVGEGDDGEKRVLRFERVRVSTKVEEEDGLFSSLLDFERAGSVGRVGGGGMSSRGCDGASERSIARAGSPRRRREQRRRRGGEDARCVQVLGRSCVEVAYMRECEVEERGDCVLVELVGDDERGGGDDGRRRRLELCLPDDAAVCREGVPSLLPGQIREGCEFMKGWVGFGEGLKRRIGITVPRWRAQDAFALAVCFLVWAEAERQESSIELDLESEGGPRYTAMHRLYMRLLDDGDGEGVEEEEEERLGLGGSERVGLGILGVGLEDEQSARLDTTADSGCWRGKGKGGGCHHVREGAIGADSGMSASSSNSSPLLPFERPGRVCRWAGLRDEWRGVLSYEGLNSLVGVWP